MFITHNFIEKVHGDFDELNYHVKSKVDYDEFAEVSLRTLSRCKEIYDAKKCVKLFQFCNKRWKDIEKIFKDKLEYFKDLRYEGNSLLELLPEEECGGSYYITNGINKNGKEIIVSSVDLEEGYFDVDNEKGIINIFTDGDYYIKFAKLSSTKMKLFDTNHNCLCNIVLSENYEIFLENNNLPYDILVYEDCVGVFKKETLENIDEDEEISLNDAGAIIDWDILGKNSKLGVAQLVMYQEDMDLELMLLFAVATFSLYKHYIDISNALSMARNRRLFWMNRD